MVPYVRSPLARFPRHRKRSVRRRSGISLTEVLVAIGITALLASILIPALQRSRENARRSQCQSHLRQIILASHNYQATNGGFPGAYFFDRILPFLELPHGAALAPVFACPSDPESVGDPPFRMSYYANGGSGKDMWKPDGFVATHGEPPTIGPKDFTDGLSQTAAYAEKLAWPPIAPRLVYWDDCPQWWDRILRDTAVYHDNLDDFANECEYRALKPLTAWVGWPHYNHVLPPNRNSCINQRLSLPTMWAITATSLHPGGVNVAMADGSCRFVADGIDREVWRAIATRAGREIVHDF